jgi:predicted ATP-grasp superfamily ATP-dependent carboligase
VRDKARPPAIVLGADTPIGLTVIRELGEHGVPVYGIARSREGIGLYSKWIAGRYVRSSDDDETIGLLNRIAAERGARYVLSVSERDILFLRTAADGGRLVNLRALVPPADRLAVVGDKMATYAVAREVGVPVPFSWQPREGVEPDDPPDELTFPCVLKWSDPERVRGELSRHALALVKSEYCYDREELARVLRRYAPVSRYPLVQAFCPGSGLGHMIFLHRGEPLLLFQHRRLSEWPPEGGTSTVCESLSPSDNRELFAASVTLLQRIGWEGAAMVEYRLDPRSGKAALMEINGRFWGSLPLAYHAGAPFAWFTYAVLGLGEKPAPSPYRVGLRCRYMIPETRRVLTLLGRRGRTQNRELSFRLWGEVAEYVRQFVSPNTRYYVFTLRDPGPFLADIAFVLWKMVSRCVPIRRRAT